MSSTETLMIHHYPLSWTATEKIIPYHLLRYDWEGYFESLAKQRVDLTLREASYTLPASLAHRELTFPAKSYNHQTAKGLNLESIPSNLVLLRMPHELSGFSAGRSPVPPRQTRGVPS